MIPKLLDTRLRAVLSEADYQSTMQAFATARTASFRVNTLKSSETEVDAILAELAIPATKFVAIPGAYLLAPEDEYRFKGSKLFREGLTYMQSLSSLLPPLVMDLAPKMKVLDVCAAPGSKTTQMAALMSNQGQIIALEQSPVRFDKLAHNTKLQWATIIKLERMDARKFFDENSDQFDAILIDAPCSAEWRIRLDDERSYGFFSLENIRKKAELQYDLLVHAYKSLKKDGIVLYSTCTLAPEENEGVVSKFLLAHPGAKLEPIEFPFAEVRPGIKVFSNRVYHAEMHKTVRILPSENFEGFYLAKIKKTTN